MQIDFSQHDLTTPDGRVIEIVKQDEKRSSCVVLIEGINSNFVGFELDQSKLFFNIKSTLAQIGLNGIGKSYEVDKAKGSIRCNVELCAIGPIAREFMTYLSINSYIGKLFALDERRRVRDPEYLYRMFGRADRKGRPLLSLGGMHGSDELIFDKVDGRTVAYLSLKKGKINYDATIFGFLSTLARGLVHNLKTRELLSLHQGWVEGASRNVDEDEILLVKTVPLHIRTVFGRVVEELLSPGYHHTSAAILQPDTTASGDVYEFYGKSKREITDLPLEFYALEPYREHIFFSDRDQLQACLDSNDSVFEAFKTAPQPDTLKCAVFVVKGHQMMSLKPDDWVVKEPVFHEFPGISHGARQIFLVERYIEDQPSYQFLKAIENGHITSQGVLFTRYFPTPIMKRALLSDSVARCLKGIYFQIPSFARGEFFSNEDRALMNDLYKFAIPIFWVDRATGKILQYVQRKQRESGIFVPLGEMDKFLKSTVFGVYGSNLISGNFDEELKHLLKGVLELRSESTHPLLQKDSELSLITGGGPGAMAVGNKIAKELNILSCANIADFHQENSVVNEQKQNPYVEAKMTYRLKELVERQAEFNLDFPIFVIGGIGTDFEFCLEEVRRKVGSVVATPILLFGDVEYWKDKITSRFQRNLQSGTIKGSEWVSNCFYCVQNGKSALEIYRRYFKNELPIGKDSPAAPLGFITELSN